MDFNKFVIWLLRSPLHGFFSGSVMVLHIHGVKSGKLYEVPVNYVTVQDDSGKRLLVISEQQRTWWRNLPHQTKVDLTFRGKQVPATAQAFEGQAEVAVGLREYFLASPKSARYFGIELTPQGSILEADLDRLAQERVVIWVASSQPDQVA